MRGGAVDTSRVPSMPADRVRCSRFLSVVFRSPGGLPMCPAPLTLSLARNDVADHEAGHAVVSHLLGLFPHTVLMEDNRDGTHTGQTQSRCATPALGREKEHSRSLLRVAVAGLLSQAKGVASRHLGEPVRFTENQTWDALFLHLCAREGTPPRLLFRAIVSERCTEVETAIGEALGRVEEWRGAIVLLGQWHGRSQH